MPPLATMTHPPAQINIDPFTPFNYRGVQGKNFEETMVWYHEFRCGATCTHRDYRVADCAVCHCDKDCHVMADCCPRTFFRDPEVIAVPPSCPPRLHSPDSDYMVTSCLPGLDPTEDGRKCKFPTLDWQQQLPVSDLSTQMYKNRYCALCNNVTSYTAWTLSLDCTINDTEKVVHASSAEELYWLAVRGVACPLKFQSPRSVAVRSCTPVPVPLVSSCNVTGQWPIYDERIVRACASFTSPIGKYRNVFCRLCNTDVMWQNEMHPYSSVVGRVSLTAVLDLQDDAASSPVVSSRPSSATVPSPQCHSQSFLDPHTRNCRRLQCYPGKQPWEDKCRSVLASTNFFRYTVGADVTLVTSLSRVKQLQDSARDVQGTLQATLRQQLGFLITNMRLRVDSVTCRDLVTLVAHASIDLLPQSSYAIDSTEESLLALFNGTVLNDTTRSSTYAWKLSQKAPTFSDYPDVTSCEKYNFTVEDYPRDVNTTDDMMLHLSRLYHKIVATQLSPLLVCRQVALGADEVLHDPEEKILVVLATNETVLYPGYSMDNDTATICLDTYLAGFGRLNSVDRVSVVENATSTNQGTTVAGLLSLSCTVVSLTLLAATFVAYLVYKELRTTAGICTMCMIAVLFLAQAVFEFGAEQSEIAGLCVALGVLAHYLWLSATFWMNACTLLMFYKLVFPLQARVYLMSRTTVLTASVLYASLSPAIIVSSSLATSHFLHGELGYGGTMCYVTRADTRRFAVALSIGCLVLLNLGLFGSTIFRLRRGSGVSSSSESRIGLWGCAKLSVITGLSWFLLFLYESLRYEAIEYVAVCLFGLYGVVVFLAFLVNKHVLDLFLARFRREGSSKNRPGRFLSLNGSNSTSDAIAASSREKNAIVTRM